MTGLEPASTSSTNLGIIRYTTHTIKWYSWNESNIRKSGSKPNCQFHWQEFEIGAQYRIRTDDFTDLQSVPLDRFGNCA